MVLMWWMVAHYVLDMIVYSHYAPDSIDSKGSVVAR